MSLPQTANHKRYGAYLHDRSTTPIIAHGVAGTGKTYGAVGAGIEWLKEGPSNNFLGVRPNVAFADELGFLPGTEEEKLAPWVRPIRQNFGKHGTDADTLALYEKKKRVQFCPLAFIQGMTYDNTFILVDEAQNMTFDQLKGLFTRTGENSRVVLCCDMAQTSPLFPNSGIAELLDMVRTLNSDCHLVEFGYDDVLRSARCKQWLMDFDKWESRK